MRQHHTTHNTFGLRLIFFNLWCRHTMEAADMSDGDPSQAALRWLLDMAEMLREATSEQTSTGSNRRSHRQIEQPECLSSFAAL
jgi:hypothetical protein